MSPFRASAPLTDRWEHFGFSVAEGVGTVLSGGDMGAAYLLPRAEFHAAFNAGRPPRWQGR